jgi:hypothetical protein
MIVEIVGLFIRFHHFWSHGPHIQNCLRLKEFYHFIQIMKFKNQQNLIELSNI